MRHLSSSPLVRWLKLVARKFAPLSRTFDPMTSALWDLYLETLNSPTLTAMENQLKCQGRSSPRTKPTRNHHHLNPSYPLLPNALTSMQEPSSPSLSSSSMSSIGQFISKLVVSCYMLTVHILKIH